MKTFSVMEAQHNLAVLLREVESRWDVCISDFGTAACCLERARPWLQSCLAEAPLAAGT